MIMLKIMAFSMAHAHWHCTHSETEVYAMYSHLWYTLLSILHTMLTSIGRNREREIEKDRQKITWARKKPENIDVNVSFAIPTLSHTLRTFVLTNLCLWMCMCKCEYIKRKMKKRSNGKNQKNIIKRSVKRGRIAKKRNACNTVCKMCAG